MLQIFYKRDGAISVFLSLILLPVMLFGGIATDAARVYMSKIIISDAGETALNAGLAQYDEELHDEYGLFVMKKTPASMSGDLERFFNATLNGTGLPDASNYQKILDLLTEQFNAMNVSGSEIYRTEVEKQQILEYMKYRAPICLAELVIDKIAQLKDSKKMMEAMEAEMDFSEKMEDCHDAFKKAKEDLDKLNQAINGFPSQTAIENELKKTREDFKGKMSRCLLMRAAMQSYTAEYDGSESLKTLVENYIKKAKKVNLNETSVSSRTTYESYLACRRYDRGIDKRGGAKKLLKDLKEGENAEKYERLIREHREQKERLDGYVQTLLETAKRLVEKHYTVLHGYKEKAKAAKKLAKAAKSSLDDVEKKLKKAKESFDVWAVRTEQLVDKKGNMGEEIEEYKKFFEGEMGEGLQNLDNLICDVETDCKYFNEVDDMLSKEKFWGKSIAQDLVVPQMDTYNSKAHNMIGAGSVGYDSVERIRSSKYITGYEQVEVSTETYMIRIANDPFYKKLQEYCKEEENQKSDKEQKEANKNLDAGKEAGKEAEKEDGYLEYDWSTAGVELPSAKAAALIKNPDGALTDLNGTANVKSSSARRGIIKKYKEAIRAATSFLDGVDRIVAKNLEGLYIAEYAMQMGSYYTVDKKDGKKKASDDIISISGYCLENRKAYRAECEYVLWGNKSSKTNVKNTVMLIFGIRLLFNAFFSFTNPEINTVATTAASAITAAAPYLQPIVKVVIKLGLAGVETGDDIKKIKDGYGVAILKKRETWKTFPTNQGRTGDNTKDKIVFDYSEYLRIFLNIAMLSGEEPFLGRIADFIQVNTETDITKDCYTMLAIQAKIKVRTTFLRKISDWSGAGSFQDSSYSVGYQNILGY